jgi:hypothetical protein
MAPSGISQAARLGRASLLALVAGLLVTACSRDKLRRPEAALALQRPAGRPASGDS